MPELVVPKPEPCNFCGALIIWVISQAAQKRTPLDAAPSDHGNVLLYPGPGGAVHASVVTNPRLRAAARASGRSTYLHHAVHCPHKARWNKPHARPGGRTS